MGYKQGVPIEKRRHPRTQLEMDLRCIRLDPDCGEVVDQLRMVDISRSGMGLVSQRPFYPGQRLVLCLPLTQTSGERNLYATIVRSVKTRHGHRVGVEFDHVPTESWCGLLTGATAAA